ncbi:MAG: hypothetical protein PHU25_18260 [Deltaproteobacteria bacterium]|nr:hypothetical protein [Deltaproteobacteria bacterium]
MNARLKAALVAFAVAAAGCTGSGGTTGPELRVNAAEINMCVKAPGAPFVWRGFQMTNTGDDDLRIANVEVRGDSSCAFQCLREPLPGEPADAPVPCPQEEENKPAYEMIVPPGATAFLTIAYTPSAQGVVDQAALVVTSSSVAGLNAGADLGALVVPMCGLGGSAPADVPDSGPDGGADGGTNDAGDGQAGCPVCKAPASGAAWCEKGYSPLP